MMNAVAVYMFTLHYRMHILLHCDICNCLYLLKEWMT